MSMWTRRKWVCPGHGNLLRAPHPPRPVTYGFLDAGSLIRASGFDPTPGRKSIRRAPRGPTPFFPQSNSQVNCLQILSSGAMRCFGSLEAG